MARPAPKIIAPFGALILKVRTTIDLSIGEGAFRKLIKADVAQDSSVVSRCSPNQRMIFHHYAGVSGWVLSLPVNWGSRTTSASMILFRFAPSFFSGAFGSLLRQTARKRLQSLHSRAAQPFRAGHQCLAKPVFLTLCKRGEGYYPLCCTDHRRILSCVSPKYWPTLNLAGCLRAIRSKLAPDSRLRLSAGCRRSGSMRWRR